MPSASVRPDDATPTRLPITTRRLIVALVSATFWWIWLFANRVRAESSVITSASASVTPSRIAAARTSSASVSASCARSSFIERGCALAAGRVRYHLPTPTWTSRNRAPGTAWPTCPVWPGSPFPQFGVPSITYERSSPTASHERQNS